MHQLLRLTSWLWNRVTGGDGDDGGDEESSGFAFSPLDASVNYAHGEPQNGVRELQRASEHADELQDAHPDDR